MARWPEVAMTPHPSDSQVLFSLPPGISSLESKVFKLEEELTLQ